MKNYIVVYGQSLFDVCLQTYGTLNRIFKLITDNGLGNINAIVYPGQNIIFDPSLIADKSVSNLLTLKKITYISGPPVSLSGSLETAGGNPLQTAGGGFILYL